LKLIEESGGVTRFEVFDLERIHDSRGTLHVAEIARLGGLPFQRCYFITGVPEGERRGGHAHKHHSEYLVCVQGSLEVSITSSSETVTVALAPVGRALYVPAGYWRELHAFSSDAIVLVLASHPFDESDYLRDWDAFRRWEAQPT